jgi:hypothetical protein
MAAGNTYIALASNDLGSVDTVTFTSISGAYTDLHIVVAGKVAASSQNLQLRFNSDANANYYTNFFATTGSSGRSGAETYMVVDRYGYFTTSQTTIVLDVMNYSNTTTKKTLICNSTNTAEGIGLRVGLWDSSAAITSVTLFLSGSTWAAGSTATLYGIAAA